MELVVRSAGGPAAITNAVRETMRRLDPDLPVDSIRSLDDIVQTSLFNQKLELGLLGTFALLAVALAAAGIYGVMSYAIAQRVQEFGIRLALGATGADIVRLVAGYALRLTGAGIGLGMAGAWLGSSVLSGLLYGIRPTDPIVFASTTGLLAAIALSACAIPARRALRVDPITALRVE
jgi:putative ABC transport system permease protein